jgi:hypothetical protein
VYILDSNVLIAAKNLHYAFDIVPGFWEWLDGQLAVRTVCSVEEVFSEISKGDDELVGWASNHKPRFEPHSEDSAECLKLLSRWALAQPYTRAAVDKFMGSADLHVIAFAMAHNHTVVTHEKSEPTSKRSIKIPDVCLAHNVEVMGPFEMMRQERARLVLPPRNA